MTFRKISINQEKSVAKEVKGIPVIASGSMWSYKGDVRTSKYLFECKTTSNKSYSLSADTWYKIREEAIKDGLKIPVMCVDVKDMRMIVVEYKDFSHISKFKDARVKDVGSKSCRVSEETSNTIYVFPRVSDKKPELKLLVYNWAYFVEFLRADAYDKKWRKNKG